MVSKLTHKKLRYRYPCEQKLSPLSKSKRQAKHLKLKLEVLSHYGNGRPACVQCGYDTNHLALSIDHIEGGGAKHRRDTPTGSGRIYKWLKAHGYPSGFQTLCMNCQWIKRVTNQEGASNVTHTGNHTDTQQLSLMESIE